MFPCNVVNSFHCCGETCRFHLQDKLTLHGILFQRTLIFVVIAEKKLIIPHKMHESHIPLYYRPNFFINMSEFIYAKVFYEYVKKYTT